MAPTDPDNLEPNEKEEAPRKRAPRRGGKMQMKVPNMGQQGPGCSRNFLWVMGIIVAFAILVIWNRPSSPTPASKPISVISQEVAAGKVSSITVNDDTDLTATLKDGTKQTSTIRSADNLSDYGITPNKVTLTITNNYEEQQLISFLSTFLPALIIVGVIYYMFRATAGANMKAMSFGQSKAKVANMSKVRFKDVAGLTEAKQELEEEVEFLKNPGKFKAIGAEIPKGVLLVGPPGTGKTMLAKAVAGEAGVPFYSISASEFVEMFVGVGASRVRDLFAKAKKTSPCIIFIDELDAIGRQRGAGLGGGHDEREQTLNQILVEMDGFETDQGVIVMAATNRPDVLDPALLRPGRFDRRVVVDLPTRGERVEVLKVYTAKKPIQEKVSLDDIAGQTAGMSPADLKNIMNEAAILTARIDGKEITQDILHQAVEKVLVGPERPSRVLSQKEKEITSVHEAGHAIVGHVLPNTDDIHKVSIISRGQALGLTWSLPREDRHLISRAKFEDELAMLLGGRLAEILYYDEPTTGASNDLQRATAIARQMVTEYGMSEKLGLRTYGEHREQVFLGRSMGEQRDYSEEIARDIDKEVSSIIKTAETKAAAVLRTYRKALDLLTHQLLEKETISGNELDGLLEQTGISKPESPEPAAPAPLPA
jgi:cell division protease FtsH